MLHARLIRLHSPGALRAERVLAERITFEHQVRSYIVRSNQCGWRYSRRHGVFAAAARVRTDRADAGEAAVNGWSAANHLMPPPHRATMAAGTKR